MAAGLREADKRWVYTIEKGCNSDHSARTVYGQSRNKRGADTTFFGHVGVLDIYFVIRKQKIRIEASNEQTQTMF